MRALALVLALAPAAAAVDTTVDFESGPAGWSINGFDTITPTGGNPGARIHWDDFIDNFGMSVRNSTNADFIGDYTAKGPVTLSIDVQVQYIAFFGSPVPRDLVVQLFDDDDFGGAPPASVWFNLGTLNGNGMPWTTLSAEVTDVFSDELPDGWNGAGAEDPKTFEPILPAGRTWTNVLQGVDRIEFTTFVPGFFYGFTNFNFSVDNVSIQSVANAWSDQRNALAGVSGEPSLVGTGSLAPLSENQIEVSNAAPGAPALFFIGLSELNAPFKGGTLVPVPQFSLPVFTSGAGGFLAPFTFPSGVPSATEIWIQLAIADDAAVKNVALTNAILGVVP